MRRSLAESIIAKEVIDFETVLLVSEGSPSGRITRFLLVSRKTQPVRAPIVISQVTEFGIKNAGEKPPALGGPSIRGYRLLFSMRLDGFQIAALWRGRSMRLDWDAFSCILSEVAVK